jgi:hypothetical protein
MLAGARERHEEVVPEVDRKGAKAKADRVSGKQWTGPMELGQQLLPG